MYYVLNIYLCYVNTALTTAAAAAAAAIVAEKGEFYKKETAKLRRDLVDLEVAVNRYVLELDRTEHTSLFTRAISVLRLYSAPACLYHGVYAL
jgi:hypothetical protein